jgi:hypothetical protein
MRRSVTFRAAIGGALRVARFEDREHVVVPVVALVEGVIHASNSDVAELVLAEEFGKMPQGWNGRPVMDGHPKVGAGAVSANEPAVLEGQSFGRVFHAEVRGERLLMEAWLDPAKAERVGESATRTLARVRAGEAVEVSVGVFVVEEEVEGTWRDGTRYAAIWREIIPDHLAFLPEGVEGACSVEMGCGAPRAAARKGATVSKGLREKLKDLVARFRPSQAEEQSDEQLRDALWEELNAIEPAFLGVDSVFAETKQVVYAVAPDGMPQLFRRGFETDSEGAVSLASEREEVKQVVRFEPVVAGAANQPVAASCGCGRGATSVPAKEEPSMEKKDRVKAIIASGKTCFKDANAAALEALDEAALKALEDHVAEASKPEEILAAAPAAPQEPKKLTDEEERAAFMAKNPDIAEVLSSHKAAQAKVRTDLTARIKAASKTYTDEDLGGMATPMLEKLATAIDEVKPKPSFVGAGAPRAAQADDDSRPPKPVDMLEKIKELRAKQVARQA